MDLVQTAKEILGVKQIYGYHLDYKKLKSQKINRVTDDDFDFYFFEQTWGNTSGGFQGVGGCAMTVQNTYVLVPKGFFEHDCLVFFGGAFCYKVPYSREFMEDVANGNVKGKGEHIKYLKTDDK